MKKILILLVFSISISRCFGSNQSNYTNIGIFLVPFHKDAIITKTTLQNSITVNVLSKLDQYVILYKSHEAVSLKSVNILMDKLEGKGLDQFSYNKDKIFYFMTEDDQFNVFSTKGGYLLLNNLTEQPSSNLLKNTIKKIIFNKSN